MTKTVSPTDTPARPTRFSAVEKAHGTAASSASLSALSDSIRVRSRGAHVLREAAVVLGSEPGDEVTDGARAQATLHDDAFAKTIA